MGSKLDTLRAYCGDHLDYEPPLEGGYEAYRLSFCQGSELPREIDMTESGFRYDAAAVAIDYPEGFDGLTRLKSRRKPLHPMLVWRWRCFIGLT